MSAKFPDSCKNRNLGKKQKTKQKNKTKTKGS